MKSFLIISSLFFMAFSCNKEAKPVKEEIQKEEAIESEKPMTEIEAPMPDVEKPKEAEHPAPKTSIEVKESIQSEQSNSLFSEGMTWVYQVTNSTNGKVTKTQEITRAITKIDDGVIYVNDLKKWKVKAGKIYELQPSRGGAMMESLKYYVPEKEKEEFSTIIGGDAMTTAIISKLKDPVTVQAGVFEDCLLLETGIGERIIFSPKVGMIKKETGQPGDPYYMLEELVRFSK